MLRATQSIVQVLVADPNTSVRNTQSLVQTLQDDPSVNIRFTSGIVTFLEDDPLTDIRASGQFLQVLVSDEPFAQDTITLSEVAAFEDDSDIAEDLLNITEFASAQVAVQVFADANDTLAVSDIAFNFVVIPILADATDTLTTLVESNSVVQALIYSASSTDSLTLSDVSEIYECSEDSLLLADSAIADSQTGLGETLNLSETVEAGLVYCKEAEDTFITSTEVFDPATLTFTTVLSGLTDEATHDGVANVDLGALEGLTCTERAIGWIVSPGPVDSVSESLSLSEQARIGENADRTESINLLESTEALVSINAGDVLTFVEVADSCHDGSSQASDTLNLSEEFVICIESPTSNVCALKQFNPQEGSKTIGVYPDPVDTGFKMTGVVSATTVELPDPNLGNRYRFTPQRVNTESRGGTLTIFSDPIWPKVRTQQFTFSGMKKEKALELQAFIDTHLGVLVDLVDHEGRLWQGIIVVVDDPIVEDRKNFWTASFEFEGDLV